MTNKNYVWESGMKITIASVVGHGNAKGTERSSIMRLMGEMACSWARGSVLFSSVVSFVVY